jgi:hypothetical protein
MANVNIKLGYKNAAFFAANPTLVLNVGQLIYLEQTGTYKIGDGVTQLSALSFLGASVATYTSVLKHTVKAGQAINKGQAVYVSSADGTNMIVSKASNVSESTSSKTMGLLETTLALNGQGFVITEGLLAGLNTNTATIGDPVWLGVNGDLIYGLINKPYAPAHLVFIGIVTRVSATVGEIFVKVQNGFELKEIHDIDLISNAPQNNDVLTYDSATSLWKNKQSNLEITYLDTIDSATLTATTVQTIMSSYSFNANDYLVGDVIQFYLRGRKIGTAAATTLRIYYNTTNSLTGAILIQSLAVSNTQLSFSSIRNGIIKSASVTEFYSQNIASDVGANSTSIVQNINIDYTAIGYFIIALVNASAADSTTISLFEVQRKR